jgi:HD-like signal output (HDOD) protein
VRACCSWPTRSYFSPAHDIETVSQALSQLGTVNVRSVVISIGLRSRFSALDPALLKPFWCRSLHIAAAAQHWAALPEVQLNVHHAWTLGLLYPIGQLFMHMGMADALRELDAQAHPLAPQRVALERERFGFAYPEVGAELTRRWRLPSLFQEILSADSSRTETTANRKMLALVHMALRQTWVYASELPQQEQQTLAPWPVELAARVPLLPSQCEAEFPAWQQLCGGLEAMLD